MKKPLTYIASAYSRGDQGINTRYQCEIWDKLWADGLVVPLAPLWSHFQHVIFPLPYEAWVEYDNHIIQRCDALLRLTATHKPLNYIQHESSGADGEVELAKALGIPVFYSIQTLYQWSRTEWPTSNSAPLPPVPCDVQTQTPPGTT